LTVTFGDGNLPSRRTIEGNQLMPRSILHCSKLPVSTKYFTDGECGSPGARGGFYLSSQSKQEVNCLSTRFDRAVILDTRHDYSAPGMASCGCHSLKLCDNLGLSSTRPCCRCEDGVAFHGNHPGGGTRCEVCDGAGVLEPVCGLCGEYGATDWIGREAFHLGCAEEVLADMHRVIERAGRAV
jgi:hypothetical protein